MKVGLGVGRGRKRRAPQPQGLQVTAGVQVAAHARGSDLGHGTRQGLAFVVAGAVVVASQLAQALAGPVELAAAGFEQGQVDCRAAIAGHARDDLAV